MNKCYIPAGYKPVLDAYDTQRAISYIKVHFQTEFQNALNLKRVSAPLFVTDASGLNDNLNGYERPVSFDVPAIGEEAEVVHSLAKWKRLALKRYGFTMGHGLYTDMNAIRRDEELDNIHSIYVDQWDWEKIITRENRTIEYLQLIVRAIVRAICDTNDQLRVRFPQLTTVLEREVTFVTSQELEDMYIRQSNSVFMVSASYFCWSSTSFSANIFSHISRASAFFFNRIRERTCCRRA